MLPHLHRLQQSLAGLPTDIHTIHARNVKPTKQTLHDPGRELLVFCKWRDYGGKNAGNPIGHPATTSLLHFLGRLLETRDAPTWSIITGCAYGSQEHNVQNRRTCDYGHKSRQAHVSRGRIHKGARHRLLRSRFAVHSPAFERPARDAQALSRRSWRRVLLREECARLYALLGEDLRRAATERRVRDPL